MLFHLIVLSSILQMGSYSVYADRSVGVGINTIRAVDPTGSADAYCPSDNFTAEPTQGARVITADGTNSSSTTSALVRSHSSSSDLNLKSSTSSRLGEQSAQGITTLCSTSLRRRLSFSLLWICLNQTASAKKASSFRLKDAEANGQAADAEGSCTLTKSIRNSFILTSKSTRPPYRTIWGVTQPTKLGKLYLNSYPPTPETTLHPILILAPMDSSSRGLPGCK
ncbi:hypothetical protein B0H19DRAFT_1061561 [Mycena capillaripes]|nr:hypothetical protein B0H19DRAFT_1061561 [Mycena capillaripes]